MKKGDNFLYHSVYDPSFPLTFPTGTTLAML